MIDSYIKLIPGQQPPPHLLNQDIDQIQSKAQ